MKPIYLDEYFRPHRPQTTNPASSQKYLSNEQNESDEQNQQYQYDQTKQEQPEQGQYKPNQNKHKYEHNNNHNTTKPYCGCGTYYSCTSALYFHIRTKHQGQAPQGTIGGPRFRSTQTQYIKQPQINSTNLTQVKLEQQQNNVKISTKKEYVCKGILPDSQQDDDQQPQPTRSQTAPPNKIHIKKPTIPHPQIGQHHLLYDTLFSSNTIHCMAPQQCKICYKDYSCTSSLNLHLRKNHKVFRLSDGRLMFQALPSVDGDFKCNICGVTYQLQGMMILHKHNKHSSNPLIKLPQEQTVMHQQSHKLQDQLERCGCGLTYQSRAALHLHIKKKHGGICPQGTKNPIRPRKKYNHQQYKFKQQQGQGKKLDIYYDSDSEQKNKPKKFNKQEYKQQSTSQQKRVYNCGCGRTYSCNSSLNLHIRRHHHGLLPVGTIGGPRGDQEKYRQRLQMRKQESEKTQGGIVFECGYCGVNLVRVKRFVCKNCNHHYLCQQCFWGQDNLDPQHNWVMDDPMSK